MRATTLETNGLLSCAACKSLLCVVVGRGEANHTKTVNETLRGHPAGDVEKVLCAGCSRVLWRRPPEADDG